MAEITDGTGKGYKLKIDSNNRAQVRAESELVIAVKSLDDGDAYQMFRSGSQTNSLNPHNILYFQNTSETRNFIINKYFLGWNGGSTNFNRIAHFRQFINSGAPSANHTLSGAGNLNTGSGNQASLLVYTWDGVGDGMTQVEGQQAGEVLISQGTTIFDIQGSTVIAPGDSVTVQIKPDEVGGVALTIEGYFE